MAETNRPIETDPVSDKVVGDRVVGVPGTDAPVTLTEAEPRSRADLAAAGAVPVHGRDGLRVVQRHPRPGFFHRLFGFIGWVFTGFGLAHAFRKHGPTYGDQEITVYTVHSAFFLWPLVLVGFIGAGIVHFWALKHPGVAVVMGWVYVATLTYTLVSLLFDFSTWKFLLWTGIIVFIYVLARLVEEKKHILILSHFFGYVRGLHPKLDTGFAMMMSWLLLIPWIGALFTTFTNGRKRFTPNEISEFHLGEGMELTDRTGMQFRTRYRDLFETLLGFGAGDLQAVDGTGTVRKHWENILFLAFLWPRMDKILHQRAATVDNTPEEPVEVEEIRRKARAAPERP